MARTSSFLVGFRYRIHYQEPIDWGKNYIICANHTSNLDITVMTLICQKDFAFIGKEELLNKPITGVFFRSIDIPVNRTSKISGYRALKRAGQLLDKQKNIVIFPEGGITNDFPPKLEPFKNGSFRLAAEKQIPIIPVVIQDAWHLMWDDGSQYGTKPGVITVNVLSPIQPMEISEENGLDKESERLNTLVFNQMRQNLDQSL